MIYLPDHGVGAVILTNSDTGGYLTGFLQRRLLEVLFDGKPEAVEQARFAKTQRIAAIAKKCERLIIPADAADAGELHQRESQQFVVMCPLHDMISAWQSLRHSTTSAFRPFCRP